MASRPVYYDLYDCGRYDGRYRSAELMVMLGVRKRHQIEHYSDMGILYQGRYRLIRVDDGMNDLLEELIQSMDYLKALGCDLNQIRFARIKNPHNPHKRKRQSEGGDGDGGWQTGSIL